MTGGKGDEGCSAREGPRLGLRLAARAPCPVAPETSSAALRPDRATLRGIMRAKGGRGREAPPGPAWPCLALLSLARLGAGCAGSAAAQGGARLRARATPWAGVHTPRGLWMPAGSRPEGLGRPLRGRRGAESPTRGADRLAKQPAGRAGLPRGGSPRQQARPAFYCRRRDPPRPAHRLHFIRPAWSTCDRLRACDPLRPHPALLLHTFVRRGASAWPRPTGCQSAEPGQARPRQAGRHGVIAEIQSRPLAPLPAKLTSWANRWGVRTPPPLTAPA